MLTTSPATRRAALQWLAGAAAGLAWPARAQGDERVQAKVERNGDLVVVDVSARVAVPLALAWATMTDYEHMTQFVDNLKSSQVVKRQGQRWEVAQSGATRVGPMTFAFDTVRAVELRPLHEIHSSLVKGDFKRFDTVTKLREQGGETLIDYHGEFIPNAWLPPLIGPGMIRDETRRQYGQLLDEMLRRHRGGAAASAPAGRTGGTP